MIKLALLLLLAAPAARAAEVFCGTGAPHAIDLWFEKAMDKTDGVTAAMRDVQTEAYRRWDDELNKVYAELLAAAKGDARTRLKDAQRAWIRYRDAEIEWLWSEAMFGGQGSMAAVTVSDLSRELVKRRVCELGRHLKTAKNEFR